MTFNEKEILKITRTYILKNGLLGCFVKKDNLYTDPHPAWINDKDLRPFQRFEVLFSGIRRYPDLAGILENHGTTFAIETKGNEPLDRGLIQADFYRLGFHYSYIAAPEGRFNEFILNFAQKRGIGALSIRNPRSVEELIKPDAPTPNVAVSESVSLQFSGESAIERWCPPLYNLPMHYLVIPLLIRNNYIDFDSLKNQFRNEYIVGPKNLDSIIRTVEKWGLVQKKGANIILTDLGKTVKPLLTSPSKLAEAVQMRRDRKHRTPLIVSSPCDAIVLRLLLLNDSIVKLTIQSLRNLSSEKPVSMPELLLKAIEINPTLARIAYLNSERIGELEEINKKTISKLKPHHYKSKFFYQFKSLLIHAGILSDLGLGGSSTRNYKPKKDLYQLAL